MVVEIYLRTPPLLEVSCNEQPNERFSRHFHTERHNFDLQEMFLGSCYKKPLRLFSFFNDRWPGAAISPTAALTSGSRASPAATCARHGLTKAISHSPVRQKENILECNPFTFGGTPAVKSDVAFNVGGKPDSARGRTVFRCLDPCLFLIYYMHIICYNMCVCAFF